MTRRQFLLSALAAVLLPVAIDSVAVEPQCLEVRRIKLGNGALRGRLIHFSDLHHKGDLAFLHEVVNTINQCQPDAVCFTGDLVENRKFFPEVLAALAGIHAPVFGVPGNHDYWSRIPFAEVEKCLAVNGGAWLLNRSQLIANGKINLIGLAGWYPSDPLPPAMPGAMNIALMHYPVWAKQLNGRQFDLLLAGHSHGGQVRLPLFGAVFLPSNVDEYDRGLFKTPAGMMYVNAGIGYIGNYHVRLNCRPEITVIEN